MQYICHSYGVMCTYITLRISGLKSVNESLQVMAVYIFYRLYSDQTETATTSPSETIRMGSIGTAADSEEGTAK